MDMHETLRAAIKAAVPGIPCDWGWNLQGSVEPRIVLTVVSGGHPVAHDGATGLRQFRVQVDVFAPRYKQARDTGAAIEAALVGYRAGSLRGVFLAAIRDGSAPETPAGVALARVSLDFMVHHQE